MTKKKLNKRRRNDQSNIQINSKSIITSQNRQLSSPTVSASPQIKQHLKMIIIQQQ